MVSGTVTDRDIARFAVACGDQAPAGSAPSAPTRAPLLMLPSVIEWGAGPRAGQALLLSAKALALLSGRFAVSRQDLKRLAAPVLRHRLVLSYAASAEGVSADEVVRQLVDWARL